MCSSPSWSRAGEMHLLLRNNRNFPGGPVVTNLPCNAGDAGSIPCRGTKIPHAVEQVRPSFLEPMWHNQRGLSAATKTQDSQINNFFLKQTIVFGYLPEFNRIEHKFDIINDARKVLQGCPLQEKQKSRFSHQAGQIQNFPHDLKKKWPMLGNRKLDTNVLVMKKPSIANIRSPIIFLLKKSRQTAFHCPFRIHFSIQGRNQNLDISLTKLPERRK